MFFCVDSTLSLFTCDDNIIIMCENNIIYVLQFFDNYFNNCYVFCVFSYHLGDVKNKKESRHPAICSMRHIIYCFFLMTHM